MTRELLFLWRKFRWNWPWSHGLFHNFWPQHRNRLILGSFCIIFHGEHDPHSLNPSIWPRTREITIFIFLDKFWERHFFPPNLNLGLFWAPNNLWGCILGGHVTGVGFLAKNKRSFPTWPGSLWTDAEYEVRQQPATHIFTMQQQQRLSCVSLQSPLSSLLLLFNIDIPQPYLAFQNLHFLRINAN